MFISSKSQQINTKGGKTATQIQLDKPQIQLEKVAIATHCNLKDTQRCASTSFGAIFGLMCTAFAHKLLFPGFRAKFWHRH